MCGGTAIRASRTFTRQGLSPRVRGNRELAIAFADERRSIPACAGEPAALFPWLPPVRVYPRVCGGTLDNRVFRHDDPGLSPRVRGNRYGLQQHWLKLGSIPACAGEPSKSLPFSWKGAVYPRVYGGTDVTNSAGDDARGLSPRVRGNHLQEGRARACYGSIPACAGEPSSPAAGPAPPRVYPRVCGGTPALGADPRE